MVAKAKTVNESMDFKRGRSAKTALGVGLYSNNPMPEINDLADSYMENPSSLSFKDWIQTMDISKKIFLEMMISVAFLEEFGIRIKKIDDSWDDTYIADFGKFEIKLYSSESGVTWKARIIDKPNKPGKTNQNIDNIDIFLTGSVRFDVMVSKIRKALKKLNIQI